MKRLGWLALGCVTVLGGLLGCNNPKNETEYRMKRLRLVVTTGLIKTQTFPDLSTPAAAKDWLKPSFQSVKTDPAYSSLDENIYTHPASGKPYIPNAALSHTEVKKSPDINTTVIFYAPEPDGDQRAVLYGSGQFKWVSESNWQNQKRAAGIP